ncbi:hypothetical protein [Psychrobium sp. 1_MG-2023]|uniref:hypothetical protein n=1 Tax=Psychrobium sp. 1_MG-2023 TaxID=3062624 RepID=UPI000C3297CD|nr:hypothetical protein [Psychrobium sp. 1_MG-2023]MDP2562846.1 hypothetical protein [Psychrobium sp. 1_MG-2023]PKF54285.1 hypothetical protein CW748_16275 [Alteromonadales bacterium alter-6D02]
MNKLLKTSGLALALASLLGCQSTMNKQVSLALDPEEQRVSQAQQQFPLIANRYQQRLDLLLAQLEQYSDFDSKHKAVTNIAGSLWTSAKVDLNTLNDADDRALYWARLNGRALIKQNAAALPQAQQQELLQTWEDNSRGLNDISYLPNKNIKRIFVTGFDPFLLDRNLNQSNPSGVAAMMLDGKIIELNGVKTQIESVMIPVRFDDFDQDLIERILTPLMQTEQRIDLIATISMGREHFDLERFPGKRRSATIPGNRNVITGASPTNPLVPLLNGQYHQGDEFVEFSLPAKKMQQAKGPYQINDNHQVTTLENGEFNAKNLAQLEGQTSVQGSGGSYLSNEISYRSIALRDKLNLTLPVGHIHTPRIKAFEPQSSKHIVEQITEMLKQASLTFK